jgi:hypothetical protein
VDAAGALVSAGAAVMAAAELSAAGGLVAVELVSWAKTAKLQAINPTRGMM